MNTHHLSNLRGILSGFFVITLGFLGSIATLHAQSVDIPDPALNAVIRQALNKFDGDLTVEDMQNLVSLQNWGGLSQIKTLQGLQAATKLEALALNQCLAPEPDLSALASLTHLTTLDLASNQLESLELPAGLNNLTTLDLGWSQLFKLILPGGLDRLTTLRLDYNEQLENVSILEDLPSLETLSLQKSHLDDFSFLEHLPALTSLDLSYYQQPSLLLPDGLSALTSLNLHGSRLTTFTLPRGLAKLRSLDLSYTDDLTVSSPRMGFYRVMIIPDLYHEGGQSGPCPDFIIVW